MAELWGLTVEPVERRTDLLAAPVADAVLARSGDGPLGVAEIDPALADTTAFCERYGVPLKVSANCVIVAAKRAGALRMAACVVLATTRADVNGVVRKHLDARKVSFAAQDDAVARTGMEYGGITPFGLPADWPVLIDAAVVAERRVVVGSGLRRSKLVVPGGTLAQLPAATVIDGMARATPA
ncbi:MAG TPA: YbaK/EbsC family protein [Streptosporangiaceae bacterium]|jgi:prolyl-tRNA editing enzyme YbaK/EbsC (Cys-tRNA(Pro) deacylase)|nr:YbaK/EbsC family protein [Streptosporangiaceae bacterium]